MKKMYLSLAILLFSVAQMSAAEFSKSSSSLSQLKEAVDFDTQLGIAIQVLQSGDTLTKNQHMLCHLVQARIDQGFDTEYAKIAQQSNNMGLYSNLISKKTHFIKLHEKK